VGIKIAKKKVHLENQNEPLEFVLKNYSAAASSEASSEASDSAALDAARDILT
jgi:hypothetical protein